jgi:hypothetical protein
MEQTPGPFNLEVENQTKLKAGLKAALLGLSPQEKSMQYELKNPHFTDRKPAVHNP